MSFIPDGTRAGHFQCVECGSVFNFGGPVPEEFVCPVVAEAAPVIESDEAIVSPEAQTLLPADSDPEVQAAIPPQPSPSSNPAVSRKK